MRSGKELFLKIDEYIKYYNHERKQITRFVIKKQSLTFMLN
ncbi:IS3 family transposase [Candidatus Peregrinibacteria bacterium]|nr:IS3 family transposase [Candidatus Peregrinibacteria bacterium]